MLFFAIQFVLAEESGGVEKKREIKDPLSVPSMFESIFLSSSAWQSSSLSPFPLRTVHEIVAA